MFQHQPIDSDTPANSQPHGSHHGPSDDYGKGTPGRLIEPFLVAAEHFTGVSDMVLAPLHSWLPIPNDLPFIACFARRKWNRATCTLRPIRRWSQ